MIDQTDYERIPKPPLGNRLYKVLYDNDALNVIDMCEKVEMDMEFKLKIMEVLEEE